MGLIFSNQPPDLDGIIRQWVERLFGKGQRHSSVNGGGDDDGDEQRPPFSGFPVPPLAKGLQIAGALILALYITFGFFTVEANERVVMFRFGKPFDVRGPGLKWYFPLVENYRIVNVKERRRVEVGYRDNPKNKNPRESLMLTSDLNIIDMQFVVQYDLNDPENFLFENRFANLRAEDVVKQVAETSMRQVVGRSQIDFVLYEGREAIADETRSLMQEILNRYKTGIQVQQVAVQNVQPPDQVQNAFEDAIKARQDRERKINEGQAYANDILPRAQGQASRIVKDAEAYKESAIILAEGETKRFSLLAAEHERSPRVTRRRLYLETMEEIMARANKVFIDEKAGDGNILYLPLDKMIRAGGLPLGSFSSGDRESGGGLNPLGEAASTLDKFKDRLRNHERGNQ